MKKWISAGLAAICIIWLVFIWFGSPDRELVWFMLPVAGLFRMIAGTWLKAVNKFLGPLLPAMAFGFFIGWSWWVPVIYATYLIIKMTTPPSLIGDGVKDSKWNFLWFWVIGYINGIGAISLGISTGHVHCALAFSLVPWLVYGICMTFSNIKVTAKYFPWKFVEFLLGASALVPAAMLIDHVLMPPPI